MGFLALNRHRGGRARSGKKENKISRSPFSTKLRFEPLEDRRLLNGATLYYSTCADYSTTLLFDDNGAVIAEQYTLNHPAAIKKVDSDGTVSTVYTLNDPFSFTWTREGGDFPNVPSFAACPGSPRFFLSVDASNNVYALTSDQYNPSVGLTLLKVDSSGHASSTLIPDEVNHAVCTALGSNGIFYYSTLPNYTATPIYDEDGVTQIGWQETLNQPSAIKKVDSYGTVITVYTLNDPFTYTWTWEGGDSANVPSFGNDAWLSGFFLSVDTANNVYAALTSDQYNPSVGIALLKVDSSGHASSTPMPYEAYNAADTLGPNGTLYYSTSPDYTDTPLYDDLGNPLGTQYTLNHPAAIKKVDSDGTVCTVYTLNDPATFTTDGGWSANVPIFGTFSVDAANNIYALTSAWYNPYIGPALLKVDSAGNTISSTPLPNEVNSAAGIYLVPPSNWTIMVYLNGQHGPNDASLEKYLDDNFEEMSSIGSQPGVNIVVELARMGEDTRYDGWSGVREGLVAKGDDPTYGWGSLVGYSVDMGNYQTLADFVAWAKENYPASNYALILSDHGAGFDGVCEGVAGGTDIIMPAQISTALAIAGIPHLSLIGFDACLMGMTEIAYQLREDADVMVASESYEPSAGWDYSPFLDELTSNPGLSPSDLADSIIDAYAARYDSSGPETTLSSIQLGITTTGLAVAIDQFAAVMLNSAQPSDWQAVREARNAAQFYSTGVPILPYDDFRDVRDFVDLVQSGLVSSSISTAAAVVDAALSSTILTSYASSDVASGTNGLTIYLPGLNEHLDPAYDSTLNFVQDTEWLQFITRLTQNETNTMLTASPTPTLYGQAVTFTATVTAIGAVIPTGTVQFKIDGSNVGSPVIVSGGTAIYSTSALPIGSHSIVAIYSGDGNFSGSTSPTYSHTVTFITHTWDGGSTANNLWSTPENWVGDMAPLPGDYLVFPAGAAQMENVNDYPSTTVFGSITVYGIGYHFQTNDSSASSVQVQAGSQLEVDKIVTDTLTLGAGSTLTIAAIPGGPLAANSALTPLATSALRPTLRNPIAQSTTADTIAASASTDTTTVASEPSAADTVIATPVPATSEAAMIVESSSSSLSDSNALTPGPSPKGRGENLLTSGPSPDQQTMLCMVPVGARIMEDQSGLTSPPALTPGPSPKGRGENLLTSGPSPDPPAVGARRGEILLPVRSVESATARLIDAATNRRPSQSPIYSWIDPTALPKIIGGGLEQSITTRNGNITSTPILASLRDELPSHVEKSDKHLTTPAISSRQAHIAALQTVVQNSRWTDTDAEVDFDMAQHIRAVKHSKQLEKAVDDVLAEEDAVLVEL